MLTTTTRAERTHVYEAIEQALTETGHAKVGDLINAVTAVLDDRPDTIVSSMWDLVELGSLSYDTDAMVRRVDVEALLSRDIAS